LHDLTRHFMT